MCGVFVLFNVRNIKFNAAVTICMKFEVFNFSKILKPIHIYFKRCSNIEYVTRLKLFI